MKRFGETQTSRVVIKYVLLNIPAAVLVAVGMFLLDVWKGVPGWVLWAVIGGWVAKDAVLFPLVRRSYEGDQPDPSEALLGTRGTATEPLAPSGYVRVRGELWQARLVSEEQTVAPGEVIEVCRVQGLTLWVKPVDSSPEAAS